MSEEDRGIMSEAVETTPFKIDAAGISLCHRPRLYWVDWDLAPGEGVSIISPESDAGWLGCGVVELSAKLNAEAFLEQGWRVTEGFKLPTFTTSRPRDNPGYRPAGLDRCSPHE